jgi:hypothetical protein
MIFRNFFKAKKLRINRKYLLRLYIIDELSRTIKDIDSLIIFVKSLSRKQLRNLCQLLSEERKNSVYKKITDKKNKWTFEEISVDKIYLRNMNPGMKKSLEKYDYKLLDFSKSREAKKFEELNYNDKTNRDVLLAEEKDGKIKLIDGCHRAVSLARKGYDNFKVIVGREK